MINGQLKRAAGRSTIAAAPSAWNELWLCNYDALKCGPRASSEPQTGRPEFAPAISALWGRALGFPPGEPDGGGEGSCL